MSNPQLLDAEERVAEIRDRLNAATPGPWAHVARSNYGQEPHAGSVATAALSLADLIAKVEDDGPHPEADAQLIAHAPADLSWALERIAELEKDAARLEYLIDSGDVLVLIERNGVDVWECGDPYGGHEDQSAGADARTAVDARRLASVIAPAAVAKVRE